MVQQVREFPVKIRRGKVLFPEISQLEQDGKPVAQGGQWKAILQCKECDVPGFFDWIEDTMPRRCQAVGVYAWEVFQFTIDRQFLGLVIYFDTSVEAVHFRLAWSDFYWPDDRRIAA